MFGRMMVDPLCGSPLGSDPQASVTTLCEPALSTSTSVSCLLITLYARRFGSRRTEVPEELCAWSRPFHDAVP
jgi:hypothetical protein